MQAPEVYWVMIKSEIVPYTTSYSNILMLGTLGVIKRLIKHRPLKCGDRKKKIYFTEIELVNVQIM